MVQEGFNRVGMEGTIEENILEKISSVKDLKKSIWKPTTVEFQQ